MITAVSTVTATPITSAATRRPRCRPGQAAQVEPKAPTIALAIVFDCTELKAKPKAMIRKIENIVPAQRWPRPFLRSRRGRRGTGPCRRAA